MSKQRRIKKLVKGHLNSKDVTGADIHADKEERLLQLMGKSTANPGNNLSDAQLLAVLLDADADSAAHKDDFAPFDARETADSDSDGKGDNKEIHDVAALIATKTATLTSLFNVDITSHAQTPNGVVDLAIAAAEAEVAGAGLTDGTYEAAEATMDALNEQIAQYDAGSAEITALWNSIKDLVPTAGVSYDAKDVTVSHSEAEGNFLNITDGIGAAAPLDIDAQKLLRNALQGRFDALVDPDPLT